MKLQAYHELKGKTFIFRIGSYNNLGGAETKAITMTEIKKDIVLNNKTFVFKIGNYRTLGGAETQSFILAKALKARYNAKIIFIADNDEGPVKELYNKEGFQTLTFYYRLNGTKVEKIIDSIKFIKFLRKLKPNFILPYTSDNCKKILNGWKYTGAEYAWWNMQDEGRFLFKTKHEKKLLKGVSEIVSNSFVGSHFLANNYDISLNDIKQYNNPIYIPDPAMIIPKWRKNLGLEQDAIVVSMIANLTRWKDHKTLFKAWEKVLLHYENKRQPCYLVLAGEEKETAKDLKALAFDLNIAHSIKMLGNISSTNALILESDLVVHSSIKEGVPNVLCEAMALHKPVVATDIPGDREALTDKYEKYTLSEPNDSDDLSKKIIFLLENYQLREEIGEFNYQRVSKHYSIDNMVNIFVESFVKHTNS